MSTTSQSMAIKEPSRALSAPLASVFADRGLVILLVLFVLSAPFVTPYLRGDGNGYYAWLRSPAIDGDLDFANEFARGDPAFLRAQGFEDGRFNEDLYTENGRIRNQWGTGAAVMWAPFFLAAHGVVLGGRALGAEWAPDGYALPYRWLTGFGTALYGFLALAVAYLIARRFARPGPALLGTLAVWGASNLLVYQYFLPFWPFAQLSLVAAVLILLWLRGGWGKGRWFFMGFLSGFAFTVHPTGAVWATLVALAWASEAAAGLGERLRAGLWASAGAVLAVLAYLVAKAMVHRSPFDTGYREQMDFLRPDLVRTLVGADHGLLSWTPVAVVGLVGLGLLWRSKRHLAGGLLAVFGLLVWVVASHQGHEQSSYGNRFFVAFVPALVVGVAVVAERVWQRLRAPAVGVAALLVLWNLLFAFQWAWGLVPKRGPVAWGEMARNQVTVAPRELVGAGRLFLTDRAAFIETVQRLDEERIREREP